MKIFRSFLVLWLMVAGSGLVPLASVGAANQPNVESAQTPEVKRSQPLAPPAAHSVPSRSLSSDQVQSLTLGPNLINNPSVENAGTNGLPVGWFKGGYGLSTRTLAYPVPGHNSTKALRVTVTNYTSGDAKWYFADVPVTAGKSYQFSDSFISDVPSIVTARYTLSNGSFSYKDLTTLSPQTIFSRVTVSLTPPAGAVSVTIFHLLKQAGTLTTDEFALNEVSLTPPSPSNLISNPGFEQAGTNGLPIGWWKGGWGNNSRSLAYPVSGAGNGDNAIQVNVSAYTSGDAKWYFTPVAVSPGIYTYSDQYVSDVPSFVTAQYLNNDGSFSYKDLGVLPAVNDFTSMAFDLSVGSNVSKVTVFHLIKSVGSLTIDNTALSLKSAPKGIFTTGAVSLRFDDGWLSQYENALPKLSSAGLKGTFYIVTHQMAEDGYSGFINRTQLKEIYNAGQEIGAHTRTHPFLSQLSPADQQAEIAGARQDLLAWQVGPVTSFAYPYGDYDSTTLATVAQAGFSTAAATINGYVMPTSDRYQLQRESVEVRTTVAQVKQWIDAAVANKQWLILSFHEVNESGNQYSTTPDTFNQIVDYLVQKQVPVIPVSQGLQSLP